MVSAKIGDVVIAESDSTVVVEGNQYFPADSIKKEYFTDSQTTTVCGWKGTASYYNITADGKSLTDAAWYYPEPKDKAKHIGGYVAFYKTKVKIQ